MNRNLLRLTRAIALTIAAVTLFAPDLAFAQNRQTLRVSTPAVPDDWHTKMLYVFKDEIEKSAPGRFDVQIHHSGTLFKQGTESAAMARGNLEMALLAMQDFAKLAPDLSLFTAGYLIRDLDHLRKVFEGPIGAEINQRVSATMDMQIINTAYLGTRQLNLRDPRNVKTPADLAGVKLRMPGSKEWLFLGQALGANPTPLAFNEIYLALKTGTIDGQDNPLPTVRAAKFYEVTKQLTLTGHLVQDIHLVISNKAWNAMTPDDQRKVRDAARNAARFNDDNRVREESEIIEFFKKQGLAVVTPDVAAFRQHVQKAYLQSEFAKDWTPGMLDRVNAVR